jgi:hypothetical protein
MVNSRAWVELNLALNLLPNGAHDINHRFAQCFCLGRRCHGLPRFDEQGVIKIKAQSVQGMAHSALGHAQGLCSLADTLLVQHGVHHEQQVEV